MKLTKEVIKKSILEIIHDHKFNRKFNKLNNYSSINPSKFLNAFYFKEVKNFVGNKKILILNSDYELFKQTLFRFFNNQFLYVNSSFKKINFLKNELDPELLKKIDIVYNTGESLPLKEKSIDNIIMFFKNFESNIKLQKSIKKILKPQGKILSFKYGNTHHRELKKIFENDLENIKSDINKNIFTKYNVEKWQNKIVFDNLNIFFIYLFSTKEFNKIKIEENIDYLINKIYNIFRNKESLFVTIDYVMQVFK